MSLAAKITFTVILTMVNDVSLASNLEQDRILCESSMSGNISIDACTRVIQSGLEDESYLPLYYYNLGVAYRHRGLNKQAIENFHHAIRMIPKFYDAYFNRAHSYLELDQIEKSLEDVGEAIRLNPGLKNAWAFRGKIFELLGQIQKAMRTIKDIARWAEQIRR